MMYCLSAEISSEPQCTDYRSNKPIAPHTTIVQTSTKRLPSNTIILQTTKTKFLPPPSCCLRSTSNARCRNFLVASQRNRTAVPMVATGCQAATGCPTFWPGRPWNDCGVYGQQYKSKNTSQTHVSASICIQFICSHPYQKRKICQISWLNKDGHQQAMHLFYTWFVCSISVQIQAHNFV